MVTLFNALLFEDQTLGLVVLHGAAISFQPAELTVGDILNPFLVVITGLVYI